MSNAKVNPATSCRFLLNDDMVVFGLWRTAMSIIIIYMYIYTRREPKYSISPQICKSNYIIVYY
jgi:hypothetical protein